MLPLMTWNERFMELFGRCVERYRGGDSNFNQYYSEDDLRFLRSIGCKPRELFDFVEDYVDEQTPAPTSALLIAAVRRDYLLVVQDGVHSELEITRDQIPPFSDTLENIAYLPRILAKARACLAGPGSCRPRGKNSRFFTPVPNEGQSLEFRSRGIPEQLRHVQYNGAVLVVPPLTHSARSRDSLPRRDYIPSLDPANNFFMDRYRPRRIRQTDYSLRPLPPR